MKDENKNLFSQDIFSKRVRHIMDLKSITMDDLYKSVNSIGYEVTKNNLSIYIQRSPNANFLIALSKALGVTADYLLGMSEEVYEEGFEYNYNLKRYKKYCGRYYFYFFQTVSSSSDKLEKAFLYFDKDLPGKVELDISIDERRSKKYIGEFLLSSAYSVGYVVLRGKNLGECVFLTFLDPVINGDTDVQLLVGAMLSVSSGDFKRSPVMSRFVLSREEISKEKIPNIEANLRLNSKYILLTEDKLDNSIESADLSRSQRETVLERLKMAFSPKKCYSIEESFILNTIKNDCGLSTKQALTLLDQLRINSYATTNNKINRAVDARMFNYIFGD